MNEENKNKIETAIANLVGKVELKHVFAVILLLVATVLGIAHEDGWFWLVGLAIFFVI